MASSEVERPMFTVAVPENLLVCGFVSIVMPSLREYLTADSDVE